MGKRIYVKRSNGKRYTSVTTVLGVIAKPALYKWYADRGWEGARKELKDAGDRGTILHSLIERHIRSEPLGAQDFPSQEIRSAFNKIVEWMQKVSFRPFLSEYQVSDDDWGVMGSLDSLAFVNGRLALPDWKGGKGIWPEHYIQTSAYLEMLLRKLRRDGAKDPIDESLIATLDKQLWMADRWIVNSSIATGDFEARLLPWNGTPEAPHMAHAACVRAFECCIDIYNWQKSTPSAMREVASIKEAQEEL